MKVRFPRGAGYLGVTRGSVSRVREAPASADSNDHRQPTSYSFPRSQRESTQGTVMVARQVLYEGHVQGVGFRYSVKSITAGYDVVGSVKNLIDGRVELEVQGEEGEVTDFLEAVLDSHLRRHIHRFVVREIPVKGDRKGFEIAG
jgi:acylphosphatase